jgi:short-subunit dehydrogenase
MLNQDTEGHIINTGSIAGLISSPYISVYDATKFAVITISESLHLELELQKAKIKVSVLCPGFVSTNLTTSDRNRPSHLQVKMPQLSQTEMVFASLMFAATTSGTSSVEIAEKVFAAIQNEQFYILPNPEFLPFLRMRMEAILNHQNPPPIFDGSATPRSPESR